MNETTSVRLGLLLKQYAGGTVIRIHNCCVKLHRTVNNMLQPALLHPPPPLHGLWGGHTTLMNGVVKKTPPCRQSILDRPGPGQPLYRRKFHACKIAINRTPNLETQWILANITLEEWNLGTKSGRWVGRSTGPDTAPAGNQTMDPPLSSPQHWLHCPVSPKNIQLALHIVNVLRIQKY
jgi:hypothetical protein